MKLYSFRHCSSHWPERPTPYEQARHGMTIRISSLIEALNWCNLSETNRAEQQNKAAPVPAALALRPARPATIQLVTRAGIIKNVMSRVKWVMNRTSGIPRHKCPPLKALLEHNEKR